MAKKSTAPKPINPRDIREKLGLNQQKFWSKVGVTQSGGSRYESGRNVPKSVQTLLTIAHGTEVQARTVVEQLRGAPL